jgi:hypothetical protein
MTKVWNRKTNKFIEIIDRDTAKKYIYKTNGKFFSAVLMTCRTNVRKYLKGVGLKFKPQDIGLMTVFDIHKGAYRFINLMTLKSLKIRGNEYQVNQTENKKRSDNE